MGQGRGREEARLQFSRRAFPSPRGRQQKSLALFAIFAISLFPHLPVVGRAKPRPLTSPTGSLRAIAHLSSGKSERGNPGPVRGPEGRGGRPNRQDRPVQKPTENDGLSTLSCEFSLFLYLLLGCGEIVKRGSSDPVKESGERESDKIIINSKTEKEKRLQPDLSCSWRAYTGPRWSALGCQPSIMDHWLSAIGCERSALGYKLWAFFHFPVSLFP